MKNTANFLVMMALSIATINLQAQETATLTLASTMNPKTANNLFFLPIGELQVDFWSKDYVKIEIEVTATNLRREQLKSLIPIGVFKINDTLEGDEMLVSMPSQGQPITVNGMDIDLQMVFRMTVPKNMKVIRQAPDYEAMGMVLENK